MGTDSWESGLPFTCEQVEQYLTAYTLDLEPWPEPHAPVAAIAEQFAEMLPRPGGVVLLALPNGIPLLRYLFGALYGGAVPVAISPATPPARLRAIAGRIGASAVVTPRMRTSGGFTMGVLPLPGPHINHAAGDVIVLTSGTSGIFSGCLHHVSSLFRNAARHAEAVGLRSADTILVTLPLNFSYSLVAQVFAGMLLGSRLVLAGPPFSRSGYAEAIDRYGVTTSSLTPYLLRRLRAEGRPPSLRMLTVGGDAIGPDAVGSLLAEQPDLRLFLTYGLTEAGPRVSTLAAHREPPHRHASVGRPLPGVCVALRNVRDDVGELLVTSDTVLVRRVGDTEGSRKTFTGPGQIATGDLFRIDADGYLYFRGRVGDSMVIDGYKVSLASIRRLAAALPGVVNARTRTCTGDHGTHDDLRYALDVYLHDTAPGAVRRVEIELRRRLLRAELPCRIRALPAYEAAHK